MALFKFRKAVDEPVAATGQPESVEAMRRRARHRLIGAAVLVLVGVVGFPLLFDTQHRPIPVDIPIEIPDRNKVKPLPGPGAAQAPLAASAPVTAASLPKAEDKPSASVGVVTPAPAGPAPAATPAPAGATAQSRPEAKPETKAESKADSKAESKPDPRPEPKAPPAAEAARADDGARAKALLEGKPLPEPGAADGRFIVQVGAFADAAKARETRMKLERAGLKTYTHVAETKEGKLTRVRVGPFATRAEADKAAEKIKGLDLQPKILTL